MWRSASLLRWCDAALQALIEEIEAKYANKVRGLALRAIVRELVVTCASSQVMANVGLFVCVHTVDEIGTAHVYDGDGSAHTQGMSCASRYFTACAVH